MLRLLLIPAAGLRATPGGFRYVAPAFSLDLSRYGIVLRQAEPLPADVQARVLEVVRAIAIELGFAPSAGADADLLSRPGAALAVHRQVLELDEAGAEAELHAAAETHEARVVGGSEAISSRADDAAAPAADENGPELEM